MNPRNAGLLLLLGALCGCNIGNSEKFVAPSAKSFGITPHNGYFWIIPGNALLDGGRTMGPPENLLYLLVICPGLSADSRGTATDYGQRSNAYSSEWTTSKGEVSVTVKWDKRADKVIIGEQQFNRNTGSVFVVIRQPDGKLVSTQLPSPGPDADGKTALNFIQKHMTNDALIASVRLPKWD
jgi:hypothetical protein